MTTWPRNDVDRFVLARLEAAGVAPSPEADRRTLVRRLYFDLTGLPPTPDEVDAVRARRPPRRLRAARRPAARVAGLRRTDGHAGGSTSCGSPTRSATTAIRSTASRPTATTSSSRSTTTCRSTSSRSSNSPATCCRIRRCGSASPRGYNRLLQTTHEGGAQDAEYRAMYQADRVRNFSETWLAGSMGCAECHDHKFDPYTQDDFYSLGRVLRRRRSLRLVRAGRQERRRPTCGRRRSWPGRCRSTTRCKRSTRKIAELEKKLTGNISDEWQKRSGRAHQAQASAASSSKASSCRRWSPRRSSRREIRILARGNWMDNIGRSRRSRRRPHFLPPARRRAAAARTASTWPAGSSSDDNPLTARVVVNRLWKRYFGVGLSKSLHRHGQPGRSAAEPAAARLARRRVHGKRLGREASWSA